ncbi:hypothetical protein ACQ4M3_37245 [Leptolyngbya sp. AN03gr2]|uniref:hypothetical protein n=1 Tax=unclassified Leptolyngbya TaxID=2650499 RepID=UPI003D3108AE
MGISFFSNDEAVEVKYSYYEFSSLMTELILETQQYWLWSLCNPLYLIEREEGRLTPNQSRIVARRIRKLAERCQPAIKPQAIELAVLMEYCVEQNCLLEWV